MNPTSSSYSKSKKPLCKCFDMRLDSHVRPNLPKILDDLHRYVSIIGRTCTPSISDLEVILDKVESNIANINH
jgi:hypothetical protein